MTLDVNEDEDEVVAAAVDMTRRCRMAGLQRQRERERRRRWESTWPAGRWRTTGMTRGDGVQMVLLLV